MKPAYGRQTRAKQKKRAVPHLRCFLFFSHCDPAPVGWAKVWRAFRR